jgi:hypothetical protein
MQAGIYMKLYKCSVFLCVFIYGRLRKRSFTYGRLRITYT